MYFISADLVFVFTFETYISCGFSYVVVLRIFVTLFVEFGDRLRVRDSPLKFAAHRTSHCTTRWNFKWREITVCVLVLVQVGGWMGGCECGCVCRVGACVKRVKEGAACGLRGLFAKESVFQYVRVNM